MVSDTNWRVEVYTAAFDVAGQCDAFTSLQLNLKHRAAGGWVLQIPAAHPQADLWTQGSRIAVWAPWSTASPLLSGPITGLSTDTPDAAKAAVLTVNGVDDTAMLADRIALPDPSSPMHTQSQAWWTYTGPAEACIRAVVGANAGRDASPGRRLCDHDPDDRLSGVCSGTTRNVRARFDSLATLIDELATIDNLAVRLYHPLGIRDLYLDVSATTDRSASVLLSFGVGTLKAAVATITAPTATHVLIAGGGEGEDRALAQRSDEPLAATWARRIETVRDARDTTDPAEMAERGDETLAAAASTAGLSLDPADLPGQQFGIHYGLGDTVSVQLAGVTWTDIVTAVHIDVTAAGGAVVRPSVGDPDTADTNTPAIYRRVRDLLRRMEQLERRV
jgi:hypothetical protein